MVSRAQARTVLTIAGSDPSGGAGVQMDLKCFAAAGVHGCSVLTAITAQNTRGVRSVTRIPPGAVEAQLEAVFDDFAISAMKTGMLHDAQTVRLIASKAAGRGTPMIVDPVLSASRGAPLSRPGMLEELKKSLIPHALLLTPNIPEAERFTDMRILGLDDMEQACKKILDLGCRSVLLKGGHAGGMMANDLFYDGRFRVFGAPRLEWKVHGTGCILSAFITAYVGMGHPLPRAVGMAKESVTVAIRSSIPIGRGMRIGNPFGVRRDCPRQSRGK